MTHAGAANDTRVIVDRVDSSDVERDGPEKHLEKANAILIPGGMAHNPDLTGEVKKRVDFIAPVLIFPGEDEMRALAQNGALLLSGKITPRNYNVNKEQ